MKVCTVCSAEWPDETNFCPNDGAGLRSVDRSDLIGSVIADKFRIERKLGEGGMGAVYLAEHIKMHRPCAIKVLTKALTHNPDAVARFNREAANAAQISHQHVCAIYDFGESADGLIFLVMEYIEGETLSSLLTREGRLSPPRAATILAQAADALQAAHDLGIVHRDLKPDNVMLTQGRDGADHVKVVDFGIAKAMGGGEEGQKVTKTGLVIGTPEYMSPEQLSGDVLDGRSDVYSLALVFYRAITGRLPFEADTAQEVLIKRLTDEPISLHDAAPDLDFPSQLQDVLDRALQRMPGDRYPTAAEFSRDVLAAVQGMARSGTGPSTEAATQIVDRGGPSLPPTRLSPASTPATPQPMMPTRPSRPSAAKPRQDGGKRPILVAAVTIGIIAVVGGSAAVALRGGGGAETSTDPVATAVKGDTAGSSTGETRQPQPSNGSDTAQDGPRQRPRPVEADSPVVVPVDPPAPRVDLPAIAEELVDIGRLITDDPAGRGRLRQTAVTRYNDTRLPDTLRARAASIVAESFDEDHDNQLAEACRWIANAIALHPTNGTYRLFETQVLGCPS